jgi:hypothetical protein
MVMGTISVQLDGDQLSITMDDKDTFLVDPETEVREEPWGFAISDVASKDLSIYRYARYMGKNLIVCFGPWDGNSFQLFNRTWVGVQENQLVAIEVFQHEEGNFMVGVVPVDLTPDRTGIIQPLEDKLSISMNAVYEARSKYMLFNLMNTELYLKYERYLLEGLDTND